MKADIALIKYDAFDNIVDAFIIENKLSGLPLIPKDK